MRSTARRTEGIAGAVPAGRDSHWAIALAIAVLASASPAQDGCIKCHQQHADAVRDQVHQRGGVGCADCHGGDATASDQAAAHGQALLGRGDRKGWVLKCGECHADVRRMNPYGLPTDQLAQYRTSRHGEDLFGKADAKVATCVDCHGSHGILPPSNQQSPVHPKNIPATCGKCHGDAELASQYHLDATIVASYRDSVHGRLLLQRGDVSAPQCATCHGNHGAVPPGFRQVGAVCGRCHPRQKELFEKSPHAQLAEEGVFACVTCHGKHAIAHPSEQTYFQRVCDLCHDKDSPPFQARARLVADLKETRLLHERAVQELAEARRHGLLTEQQQLELENANTNLLEMEVAQHALDVKAVDQMSGAVRTTLHDLEGQLAQARQAAIDRRLALIPVVLFLLLMSSGFWVRFRRIHHGSRR